MEKSLEVCFCAGNNGFIFLPLKNGKNLVLECSKFFEVLGDYQDVFKTFTNEEFDGADDHMTDIIEDWISEEICKVFGITSDDEVAVWEAYMPTGEVKLAHPKVKLFFKTFIF